ncbi:hypothetical protein HUN23_10635 [Acinetobacter oleivorans]|uniref:hypothetical protein n=1 Tax=Acinetobacter oleivorans TaxID=1148157 RepID=UPI001580AE17|nr:hypothetical protein [Acinetobacter oleivorans]NUF23224.1 hypothetical protein [Acinetobacter oleivorans]
MKFLLILMNKVKVFFEKLGHPSFTVFGVISLGIGGAFVSSYHWSNEWSKVSDIATFIAFILTNSYLWLFGGAIIYLLSEYVRYEKTKKIEGENKSLNERIIELNGLSTAVNGYQENIQALNSQIYDLQNRLAIGWLKTVFKQNKMNSNERVTIYFELNGEFSLLARYSSNPTYKMVHRQKFPLNEGVISQAWSHGKCIENTCPSYNEDVTQHRDYMSQKYSFLPETIDGFQMKSCWYVAIAISKADDNIGVIVFESTNQNVLNETEIDGLISYCKSEQSHLAQFIEESQALENAKRMGSAKIAGNTDNDFLSSLSRGEL